MMAMKIPYTAAHGTVRFSLSRYTTEEEIDYVLEKVPALIAKLREMSPYWKTLPAEETSGDAAPSFNPVFKGKK